MVSFGSGMSSFRSDDKLSHSGNWVTEFPLSGSTSNFLMNRPEQVAVGRILLKRKRPKKKYDFALYKIYMVIIIIIIINHIWYLIPECRVEGKRQEHQGNCVTNQTI